MIVILKKIKKLLKINKKIIKNKINFRYKKTLYKINYIRFNVLV